MRLRARTARGGIRVGKARSWRGSVAWSFITEDGKPLPESLEVPLYAPATGRSARGGRCPDPYYPEGALQRLVESRNEIWETQLRSDHPG